MEGEQDSMYVFQMPLVHTFILMTTSPPLLAPHTKIKGGITNTYMSSTQTPQLQQIALAGPPFHSTEQIWNFF